MVGDILLTNTDNQVGFRSFTCLTVLHHSIGDVGSVLSISRRLADTDAEDIVPFTNFTKLQVDLA